jgi:3-methyladenine DNA glycosylase AlkD
LARRPARTKTVRSESASLDSVLRELRALSNPKNVAGMARFGINSKNTLGVSVPQIREIAGKVGKNHVLAQQLWKSGIHEARILAGFVDEPHFVTEVQMETWVSEFDSWDVCDNVCGSLFDKTALAYEKAAEWSERREEFVKRAGFALMAYLAVHDKKTSNEVFAKFLPIIKRGSDDHRNFVRKAVNWALRQIGKRNQRLNKLAVQTAREIQKMEPRPAKWIASDALRELTDKKVLGRLRP